MDGALFCQRTFFLTNESSSGYAAKKISLSSTRILLLIPGEWIALFTL